MFRSRLLTKDTNRERRKFRASIGCALIQTPCHTLARILGTRLTVKICSDCYDLGMALLEITYQLQAPLTSEQLGRLGEFANAYGLRRFRVDKAKNQLSFEYAGNRRASRVAKFSHRIILDDIQALIAHRLLCTAVQFSNIVPACIKRRIS